MTPETAKVLEEVAQERENQDATWGTKFDDQNNANDWVAYIAKQAGKATTFPFDATNFRQKMIEVAAMAVAAVETFDRLNGQVTPHTGTPLSDTTW